jgi:hypothetical protein
MKLEDIIRSEINQSPKDKPCMIHLYKIVLSSQILSEYNGMLISRSWGKEGRRVVADRYSVLVSQDG